MNYKVLLTTSGIGSRLGDITKYTNKSLVRIGKKPIISYIIESYPEETSFVVTLGYCGDQVRDFLDLVYPEKDIEFVQVDKYDGPGSSLGYSMLCAKNSLDCSFVYHACDTLTKDTIPLPDRNWIAGYKGKDSTVYASWRVINNEAIVFSEKGATNFDYLHIGLVGISDYKIFWNTLEQQYNSCPENSTLNDCQVIEGMLEQGINFELIDFLSWQDIGNVSSLNDARKNIEDHFDNLDKIDESIFIFDKFVVKFFYNQDVINKRVSRADILKGLVPEVEGKRSNFYRYKYIDGDLYSRVVNVDDFKKFLEWSKGNLWVDGKQINDNKFQAVCKDFYYTKTLKRVGQFLKENNINDKEELVSGEIVPSFKDLISQIDFEWLTNGKQCRIHGDFILENIIKTTDSFCLVDWRQDFGGLIEVGDIYYDLAKLNHNLIVNHDIISANQFTINMSKHSIECDILRRNQLVDCQLELHKFINNNSFEIDKVKILTGIIWLNMSPLHHHPFNLFLYYFGKYNLWKALKEKKLKI